MTKTVWFLSMDQQVLGWKNLGKTSTVKDLYKPETHKLFWKSKVYGGK